MKLTLNGVLAFCGVFVSAGSCGLSAQTATSPSIVPYTLNIAVDEVSVPFHAGDWQGVPIDDLVVGDLRITDNGKRRRRIVSFEAHRNLPVRVGILVDTSRSVLEELHRNQWVATVCATSIPDASRQRICDALRFAGEGPTGLEQ
jgi:hypothetical protein